MLKEKWSGALTPSATFNSKIRGKKKIEFASEHKNIISIALSLIWLKTDQKVEYCWFEKDKVRISYSKNEGRAYFDLLDDEDFLSEFVVKPLENKV